MGRPRMPRLILDSTTLITERHLSGLAADGLKLFSLHNSTTHPTAPTTDQSATPLRLLNALNPAISSPLCAPVGRFDDLQDQKPVPLPTRYGEHVRKLRFLLRNRTRRHPLLRSTTQRCPWYQSHCLPTLRCPILLLLRCHLLL